MPQEPPRRTAQLVAFAEPEAHNRFTVADRLALLQWRPPAEGLRLAIHKRCETDPPEVGEFASIYPADVPWAAWGAVRQGGNIRLWRARDGRDIGRFPTMGEALAAVTAPDPQRR